MPRVLKTVLPRIRKSLAERGVIVSLVRSVLLPFHLLRDYQAARRLPRGTERSPFDLTHGVETDGDHDDWTYLSDLTIASPNWIQGNNYCGIDPERFAAALSSVPLRHEDFTFIDFGSGKGRALLLASHFPFRRVVGIEFSRELHAIAEKNIRTYPGGPNPCSRVESICMDFLDFDLPAEPSVLFFFDPCSETLFRRLLDRIRLSLLAHPRQVHLIYVAPGNKEALLDSAAFLVKAGHNEPYQFSWYRNA